MTTAQTPEAQQADVIIAGGGLIGAAFALAAAKEGVTSHLVDRTPRNVMMSDDFDGRAYAVALASRRFLSHISVWPELAEHAGEIKDILVSDSRPGERASPLHLHFDHREMGPSGFGHMIEDRHMRQALLRAVEQQPLINHITGAEIERFDLTARPGVTATLADGRRLAATVMVGADGRGSEVAKVIGAQKINAGYDQVGLVCAIEHDKPHHGVAHELFLPSGPFAILPLANPNRSALVWTERASRSKAYEQMTDNDYVAEIQRRIGPCLGAVALVGKRWVYPLSLSLADRFYAPKAALIGDAARGIHPIAGQGMNYGLRDAAALAEVLGDAARRGEDLGDGGVLARYQAMRRADSVMISMATDGLNRLFSNDIGPLRWARRFGLAAFGSVGPLRRAAMRFAAGDRSDLPRSMRSR